MKDNMNINREQLTILRQGGSPSQHRDCWSKKERQQLEDMYYQPLGISEMAIALNRSECAIFNQLELMGVFKKSHKPKKKSTKCKCSKCNCENCDRFPAKQV